MTRTRSVCPACPRNKGRNHYVCSTCWHQLTPEARAALNRKDDLAGVRLLQLHRQLSDGVPLSELQISP